MGFLSLLGLMVTGGIALSGTARNTMSDDREKAKQRELGYITYYDHRLILRRISDDAPLNVVWSEHGKYEVCDKKTYLGKGIYIIDEKVKREWEEEQKRKEIEKREREYDIYSKSTRFYFELNCKSNITDPERLNKYIYRDNPQQYWYIPYLPFSNYGLEAGRANWSIHVWAGGDLAHGCQIYDSFNKKFVFLLIDFRRDKVTGIEPLEEALRYVIDDLEEGKSYLLDLTEDIVCFQPGIYTVDAIPRCRKGSQVELPPDHVLLKKTTGYDGPTCEGFAAIKKASDRERQAVEEEYKKELNKTQSSFLSSCLDWQGNKEARTVGRDR